MLHCKGALLTGMKRIQMRRNELLARHTTFRIGGPADLFAVARSEEDLLALVMMAREEEIGFLVLGMGSNVLVSDRGVRGLVVLNRASDFHFTSRETGGPLYGLHAASGALLGTLVSQAARRGLGGLEWAVGIPGTLGGTIVQNAGAYGRCMADVVSQVRVLDRTEGLRTLTAAEIGFGYRTSRFRHEVVENLPELILSADLNLHPEPWDELQARMADYISRRRREQPRLPSAGSVFKNPPGDYAGRLIEEAGLKGMCEGDAMVALEHANFIVNMGNARARDVKVLIDRIRDTVAQRFGIVLELEIQLVGDWHESCD